MIRRVFLGLAFFLSGPLSAEPVLVSVGQLEDATRLVLTFDTRPDWATQDDGRQLRITFAASGFEVNVTEGNRFVEGSRIDALALNSDGDVLTITLACDCRAKAYDYGSGSLVVEVRDAIQYLPPQTVMSAAPEALQRPTVGNIPEGLTTEYAPPHRTRAPQRILARPREPDRLPIPVAGLDGPWPSNSAAIDALRGLGSVDDIRTQSQAVEFLSREFARAAAQGLVQAGADAASPRTEGLATDASDLDERSNLSVTTGLDRDLLVDRDRKLPTHEGAVCMSDHQVDLTGWGDTTDVGNLGRYRLGAVAENGGVLPKGAKALARYYIALGFGSEAARAAGFLIDGREKDLLLAMADIVDHGKSRGNVLDGQIYCKGKVALWAALARPITPGETPISTDAILSTFSALPPHIRAHLGPVLAERLRAVGLESEARHAVSAVARGGLQSNESELVTARLELGGTRPEEARDTLADLSTGTDVTAADALLELLMDAERRGMAPNPDWVEDAPSLSRATEGNDVAADLNLAGLRGRIALGQFNQLRRAIVDDTPGLTPQTRNDIASDGIVEAARVANDVDFLQAELGLSRLISIDSMAREARYLVSRRLLDIGLADRAADYLPGSPSSVKEVDTTADVLVATGQFDQAIALLEQADTDEAVLKLAQVLTRSGNNQRAIDVFEGSGQTDAAARAAMRAGEWSWIAQRDIPGSSGVLSDTARGLLDGAPPLEDPAQPMNGALIEASEDLRAGVNALLGETQLSDPAG